MKEYYTAEELAEIIDELSVNVIRKLGRDKLVPTYHIFGKRRFYKEGDVREYIRKTRQEPKMCSEREIEELKYMHYKDIARLTGMSLDHVRKHFRDGHAIPICRFRNVVIFRKSDVLAYIESRFKKKNRYN